MPTKVNARTRSCFGLQAKISEPCRSTRGNSNNRSLGHSKSSSRYADESKCSQSSLDSLNGGRPGPAVSERWGKYSVVPSSGYAGLLWPQGKDVM